MATVDRWGIIRTMTVRASAVAICLLVCSLPILARASQTAKPNSTESIYVEPFATRVGAETIRRDVLEQLRKLHSVSIASDASNADVILGGGGEIWIKGYRSHNPQLGKVAGNGTAIYSGYLSIELRNKSGETIWSYLATPPSSSGDISKDMATAIVGRLAEVLDKNETLSRTASSPQPTVALLGAGATFPYPVYEKWLKNYHLENPSIQITYEATGSEDGIRQLLSQKADFAGSDSPQAVHDIAPESQGQYIFFPSVIGAVVPVVNLPGVRGDISFTPEALAGIYLGKIKKWNDPVLVRANRDLHLPDLDIVVVHRADGSGTSYVWTDYLSKANADWRAQVGTSLNPRWPTGQEATGNDGVSKLVSKQSGAIGYVEFIYALTNHLSYGKVKNPDGEFVAASLESIALSATQTFKGKGDFKTSIVDSPAKGAYPISSFTWIVIPARSSDDAKSRALKGFLQWMLDSGQRQAAALGYVELPKELIAKESEAIARIH